MTKSLKRVGVKTNVPHMWGTSTVTSSVDRAGGIVDLDVFDRTPISLKGFTFKATGVEIVGRPTLEQYSAALQFAAATVQSCEFWLGALVAYAESRKDWTEKLDQAMAVTKLERHTLHNHGSVYRSVCEKAREIAPSFSHARVVQGLDDSEQVRILSKAKDQAWTVRDTMLEVRTIQRPRILEGQAILKGKYRVLIVDCPWTYNDSAATGSNYGSASHHYAGMSIEDLCKLPIESHLTENAVAFFWVTAPLLYQKPGPREVIEAWGLTPKTGMVWHKGRHNFGHYVSVRHEHVIIATRGSCTPDRPTPMIDSVFTDEKQPSQMEHSEKPERLRAIVERLYDGPYLELFGRHKIKGWTVFGNDARLWHAEGQQSA